jgi:hypothetical protein
MTSNAAYNWQDRQRRIQQLSDEVDVLWWEVSTSLIGTPDWLKKRRRLAEMNERLLRLRTEGMAPSATGDMT